MLTGAHSTGPSPASNGQLSRVDALKEGAAYVSKISLTPAGARISGRKTSRALRKARIARSDVIRRNASPHGQFSRLLKCVTQRGDASCVTNRSASIRFRAHVRGAKRTRYAIETKAGKAPEFFDPGETLAAAVRQLHQSYRISRSRRK